MVIFGLALGVGGVSLVYSAFGSLICCAELFSFGVYDGVVSFVSVSLR